MPSFAIGQPNQHELYPDYTIWNEIRSWTRRFLPFAESGVGVQMISRSALDHSHEI